MNVLTAGTNHIAVLHALRELRRTIHTAAFQALRQLRVTIHFATLKPSRVAPPARLNANDNIVVVFDKFSRQECVLDFACMQKREGKKALEIGM